MPPAAKAEKGKKRGKKVLDPIALERARIEEMERLGREEAMLLARLRELTEEEEAMTLRAANVVEARWMVFLRECKQKELVAEIEIVRRAFESAIDRKNAVIEMLFKDLAEVEEQHRLVFQSHMTTVDALTQMQVRRMADLEAEFDEDLLAVKTDYEKEMLELRRKHEHEVADLKLILDNMASEAEQLQRKLQEETSEAHDTALEKMEEERKQMQNELIKTSEAIRAELDARYKEFMTTAQVNMKDYMDKSKEDAETTERIASQLKRIEKLQESVTSWRTNLARNAREWEEKNSAIQQERDATIRHLKALKNKMESWRNKEASRLAEFIKNAKDCEDQLRATVTKAEKILSLVELGKPLETEREQVLSFESNIATSEIEREVKRLMAHSDSEEAQGEAAHPDGAAFSEEWLLLERFWTKHNKVVLDNAALSQEKYHLEEENKKLQVLLKQYLEEISVNDAVMRAPNTLLLTSRAPNVVEAVKQGRQGRGAYNTVVEGNKFVADVTKQMVLR
ncbi:flagellar associated protein [Trypanosoma conorhini]|uniref:Dynein regulatory complex subunit 2 n=1 Tax=Trypanosoma conorhini TaxID=83891 RepID=A0A422PPC6_9TRYP|nr:flagellar associated protein [Trypanosoma conorhini]RNF19574.1 flagellar associated protein [Trypanosoma conorhini]